MSRPIYRCISNFLKLPETAGGTLSNTELKKWFVDFSDQINLQNIHVQ